MVRRLGSLYIHAMILGRTTFFVSLFLLASGLLAGSKLIWLLRSKQTTGYFAFLGQGGGLDQIRMPYAQIYFRHAGDTIWFKGPSNIQLPSGTPLQVRYLPNDPSDAKVVTFIGLWGNTAVYGGIVLLMLVAVFLHPDIVPRHAQLRVRLKRPFIEMV